jgi:hypothetical protein
VPRADGAEPDKDCDVEEHVDRGLQRVVGGLYAEPVVPGEGVAGDEAGENVVAADEAVGADDEELAMSVFWLDLGTKVLTAKARAKTKKLSRSTYFFSSAQGSSFFATHPHTNP